MAKSTIALKDRERPQADWIIEGLLKRQNTGFIMGQPKKACKSWLLLDLAWCLSEGKPIWGTHLAPPRPMRTLYFTQEDTEDDIHDRVMAHISGGREANDRLWIVPKNMALKLDTMEGRAMVAKEINEVRHTAGEIDLIIFDPMRRIHHGDENDSAVIAKLWATIDSIHRQVGCATLIAHHITKPPQDRSLYDPTDPFNGRGSGDIYGGGDAFMMVVPGRRTQRDQRLAVHFESKRGRPIMPVNLEVSFEDGRAKIIESRLSEGEAVREVTL